MLNCLSVGDTFTMEKIITSNDVDLFAEVSGDKNPLHLDDEYAKKTIFGGRIAYGMISASIISGAIGMYLPGPGTIYLSQSLNFHKAVKIGDTIIVEIKISEITEKSKFNIAKIDTTCKNQKNEIIVDGTATVIPPQPA